MLLFERSDQNLKLIRPARFGNEKELQHLVETNLATIFRRFRSFPTYRRINLYVEDVLNAFFISCSVNQKITVNR